MDVNCDNKETQKWLENNPEVIDAGVNEENNPSKAGDNSSRKVLISTMVMTGDTNHNFNEEDAPASIKMQSGKACMEVAVKQNIPKEQPISGQPQQMQCDISTVEDSCASQDSTEVDEMSIIVKEKNEEFAHSSHSGSISLARPGEKAIKVISPQVNGNSGMEGTSSLIIDSVGNKVCRNYEDVAQEDGNSKSKEGNENFLSSSKCIEKPLILKEDRSTSLVSVVDRIKRALQRVSQMYEESKLKNGKGNVPDQKTVEKLNTSSHPTTPYLSGSQVMPGKPQPIANEGNTQGHESQDSAVKSDCGDGEVESSLDLCTASTKAKANKQIAVENVNEDSGTFEVCDSNPQVLDSNVSAHSEKTDHNDDAMLDASDIETGYNVKQTVNYSSDNFAKGICDKNVGDVKLLPQVVDSQNFNSSYSTPKDNALDGSSKKESSSEKELFEGIYDNIFEKVKLDSEIVREQEAMEIASSLFLQNTEQDIEDDRMNRSSDIHRNAKDGIERNEDIGEYDNFDFAVSTVYAKEISEEEAVTEGPSKQTAAQRLIEKFKLNIDNNLPETGSMAKCHEGRKNLPAERVYIKGQGRSIRKASKGSSNLELHLGDKQGKLKHNGIEKVDMSTKLHQETKERGENAKRSTSHMNSSNYLRLPPQLMKKGGKSTRINRHKVKEAVKRYREQFRSRKCQVSNAETSDRISSSRKGKAESVQPLSAVEEPRNVNTSVMAAKSTGNSSYVTNCALEAKSAGTEVAKNETSHREHQGFSKTIAAPGQVKCLSAVKKPMIADTSGIRVKDVKNSSNVNICALEAASTKTEAAKHKTSHKEDQSLSKTVAAPEQVKCLSAVKKPMIADTSGVRAKDVKNSRNGKICELETDSTKTEVAKNRASHKGHQSLFKTSAVPRQVECLSGWKSSVNASAVQAENVGNSNSATSCALVTKSAGTDNVKYKASHKRHQSPTKASTVWKQAATYKVCVKIICTTEKASYVKQTKKGPVNVCDKSVQITTVKNRVSPEDCEKYAAALQSNSMPVNSGRPAKQQKNEDKSPLVVRDKNILQLQQPVTIQEEATIYGDKREGKVNDKTKAFSIASSDDDEIEIIENPVIRKCITSSRSVKTKTVSSMTDCNKAVATVNKAVATDNKAVAMDNKAVAIDNTAVTLIKQSLSSSVVNTSSCSVPARGSTVSIESNYSSMNAPVHNDRNKVLANHMAYAVPSSVQSDGNVVALPQATSIGNSKIAVNATNSMALQDKSNSFPKIVGVCSLAKPNGKINGAATLSQQDGVHNVSKQNSLKIDIAENPVAKSILETLLKGKSMLCKSSQYSVASSVSSSYHDLSIERPQRSQNTSCCIDSLNSAIASDTGSVYTPRSINMKQKPYAVNSTTLPGNIFSSLASLYSQKTTALSSSTTSTMHSQQAESMSVPHMNAMQLLQQMALPHSRRISELAQQQNHVPVQQHRNFYQTGTYCIPQADSLSKPQETYVPKQHAPTASLPIPGYQPPHQAIDSSMRQGVFVRIMKDGEGKYVLVPVPKNSNSQSPVILQANYTTPNPIPQSWKDENVLQTTAQDCTPQHVADSILKSVNDPTVALNTAQGHVSEPLTDSIPHRVNSVNIGLTTAQNHTTLSVTKSFPNSQNRPYVALTTAQDCTFQPFPSSIPQHQNKPNIVLTTAQDHTLQSVTTSIPQSQNNANVALTTTLHHALQPVPNSVPSGQQKLPVALTTAKDLAPQLVEGLIPNSQNNSHVALITAQSHALQPVCTTAQNDVVPSAPNSVLQTSSNPNVALTTNEDHAPQPVADLLPESQKNPALALTIAQNHAPQPLPSSTPQSCSSPYTALTNAQHHTLQPVQNSIPKSQEHANLALATVQDPTLQPVTSPIPASEKNPDIELKIASDHMHQPVTNVAQQHQSNPDVARTTGQNKNCQTLPNSIPQSQNNANVAVATVQDYALQPVPNSIPQDQSKPSVALNAAQSHTSQPLLSSIPQHQNNATVAVTTAKDNTVQPLTNSTLTSPHNHSLTHLLNAIPQSQRTSNVALTIAQSCISEPVKNYIPQNLGPNVALSTTQNLTSQPEINDIALTTSQSHASQPTTNPTPKSWGVTDIAPKIAESYTSQPLLNPIPKNKIRIKSTMPTLTYNHPFASQAPKWAIRIADLLQNKGQFPMQSVGVPVCAPTALSKLTISQVPLPVGNMPQIVAVKSVSGTEWTTSSSLASLKVTSEDVQSKAVTNDSSSRADVLSATSCQARERVANHLPMQVDSKMAHSTSMPVGKSSSKTFPTQLESTIKGHKEYVGNVGTGRRVSGNVVALSAEKQHLLGSHENVSSMESNSHAISAKRTINLKGEYDTSPFWLIQVSKKRVSDDLRYELQSSVCRSMRKNFAADVKGVERRPKDCEPSVVKQIMEKPPFKLNSKKFEIKLGVFENQFALTNPNRPKHYFPPDCFDQQFIQNIGLESVVAAVKEFEGVQEVVNDNERNQWMFVQCREALERRMGKSIKRKLKEAMIRTSAIIERKVAKLEDSMKTVNSISEGKQVLCGNEVDIDRSTDIDKNEKQKNDDSKLIGKEKKGSRDSAGVVPDIDIGYYASCKDNKISTGEISAKAKSTRKIAHPQPLTNPIKRKFVSSKGDAEAIFVRKRSSVMNRKTLNRKRDMPLKVSKEAGGGVKKMKCVNGFKVRELFVGVEDILL